LAQTLEAPTTEAKGFDGQWFSNSCLFERLRKVPVTSVPSKTAFADRTLERDDLSPEAHKQIIRLRDQWAADEEIVTRRPGRLQTVRLQTDARARSRTLKQDRQLPRRNCPTDSRRLDL
jgi:hypothetical protein